MKRLLKVAGAAMVVLALIGAGYKVPSVAGLGREETAAVSPDSDPWADQVDGLTPGMATRVRAALSAASDAGVELRVESGYRSTKRQAYLYDQAVRRYGSRAEARRWVLPPDESAHPEGRAVDVGPESGAKWLQRRGYRHGLCRPYDNEPWHFEASVKPGHRCPARKANAAVDG